MCWRMTTASIQAFVEADIILIVSRSGKTPTCLYLGLQYGIAAPTTRDAGRYGSAAAAKAIETVKHKLFGLTLTPAQLFHPSATRPDSEYASLTQCQWEIQWQEALFNRFNIPYLDTTRISIEEISATILDRCGLKRQLYG